MFPEFVLMKSVVSLPEAKTSGYTVQIRWGRLAIEVTMARLPKTRSDAR